MLFNSVAFLVFFPVVSILYFAWPDRRWRVLLLLFASCVFYMAFVPAYILILAFTIVVDYVAGILIFSFGSLLSGLAARATPCFCIPTAPAPSWRPCTGWGRSSGMRSAMGWTRKSTRCGWSTSES
jgi:hypothetical protein